MGALTIVWRYRQTHELGHEGFEYYLPLGIALNEGIVHSLSMYISKHQSLLCASKHKLRYSLTQMDKHQRYIQQYIRPFSPTSALKLNVISLLPHVVCRPQPPPCSPAVMPALDAFSQLRKLFNTKRKSQPRGKKRAYLIATIYSRCLARSCARLIPQAHGTYLIIVALDGRYNMHHEFQQTSGMSCKEHLGLSIASSTH